MNQVRNYLYWLINPVEKGKEVYLIINLLALSVAVTAFIFLLTHILSVDSASAFKDVLTGIAALVASIVALLGLSAWKKQLKGKTDYEIARRYLKAALRLRDSMKFVRNPFVHPAEMERALKEHGFQSNDYTDHQKTNRAVYSVRWKKVQEAWTDLEAELLEAEVSWGPEAVAASKPLIASARKLVSRLQLFLDGYSHVTGVDELIYDQGSIETPDAFTITITENANKIEDFLRKYLG